MQSYVNLKILFTDTHSSSELIIIVVTINTSKYLDNLYLVHIASTMRVSLVERALEGTCPY